MSEGSRRACALLVRLSLACLAACASPDGSLRRSATPPAPTDETAATAGRTSGWEPWGRAPSDCHLEIAVRPSPDEVPGLAWRPCEDRGCERADAPEGGAFGGSLAAAGGTASRYALSRRAPGGAWDTLIFEDDEVALAFRSEIPASRCLVGAPFLGPETASVAVLRVTHEDAPWVYSDRYERLHDPRTVVRYGPEEGAAVLPRDLVQRRADHVLLIEHGRFALRSIDGTAFARSTPPVPFDALLEPTLLDDGRVFYVAWSGGGGQLFELAGEQSQARFPSRRIDRIATDGATLVFVERAEDGAASVHAVDTRRRPLAPRRLLDLPAATSPALVVNAGYVATRVDGERVLVARLADGVQRLLGPASARRFSAGTSTVAIGGGFLFVRSSAAEGPLNSARTVERWALATLFRADVSPR